MHHGAYRSRRRDLAPSANRSAYLNGFLENEPTKSQAIGSAARSRKRLRSVVGMGRRRREGCGGVVQLSVRYRRSIEMAGY